jgi:hypothetical protein
MAEQRIELSKDERQALDEIDATANALIQQRVGMLKLIAVQKGLTNANIDYRGGALIVISKEN